VNAEVLKTVFDHLRKGALTVKPVEYWSEKEAHHLNNMYTMYVASRFDGARCRLLSVSSFGPPPRSPWRLRFTRRES
jgi:hypothetical protein